MVKVSKNTTNIYLNNKSVPNHKENSTIPIAIGQGVHSKYSSSTKMANDVPSTSGGVGLHTTPVTVLAVPVSSRITSASASTKMSSSQSQQQQQQAVAAAQTTTVHPSIHIAPAPRLALHHLHALGPIAIQANPNPWPIVEPVFHFGPGFEHQNYCPTHSQGPQPHEYVVFFHVNAGVSVTFQISGNREVIRGPVTVPMVSQSGSPPMPMPVQVPPGHVMQQIVDESGTLRHVILSTQHQQIHSQGGVQPHIHSHYINGVGQHFYSPLPATFPGPGPGTHFHPMPGGHLHPQSMPHSQHSPSPPNSYHKDERTQRQHTKLLRKLDQKQREMNNSALSTPAHSPSPRKNELNGIKRTTRNGASSVGTSEDGEESSSVPDDEDDVQSIIEQLSTVQLPQVSEITSRGALLQWTAPASSENVVLNSRDLQYDVLLSDRGKEGKYKVIFKGQSLSCRIRDLRPGQEYYVCLQVHFQELNGSPSEAAVFTTPPCEPDEPPPPKLLARSKNSLQLRWNAPNDNGSHIQQYVVEFDDGKGKDFIEIGKTKGKQYSLQKLQPSTWYTFRLAAINECGKSAYSETATYRTSGNPPPQPAPPTLQNATSTSLYVTWLRKSQDEEYVLQINDNESGHGFLPAYTGRDVFYECQNLRRATNFQFRLRAENEAGQSLFSDEVTFQTMPERPGRPQKPQVKGKIHANHFRVKWEPPQDRGGAEISAYIVEISSGACFERIYHGSETEATCDRLHPGTTYQVKVACEGAGGTSQFSEPLTVTTEAVAPDAPSPPYCNSPPGPYTAVLQWDKPDYNGGALVTEFEVELERVESHSRQLIYKGKETHCVASDLSPGELYSAQVRSINRIGHGPWSDELTFTAGADLPCAPDMPTIVVVSPTHLIVSWDEPRTNGAPISEYRLEYALSAQEDSYMLSYQGIQTSSEIRNLIPYTKYCFRVCATNLAGTSPFSPVASIQTPASVPNAPTIESHETSSNAVYLSWTEPLCNGSPILYYKIEYADRVLSTETNVLEWSVEDLMPETTYRFKIQAVNDHGAGPFSSVLRATTKPLPPKAPKLECINVGHNFLKLKWGEGKNVEFVRFHVELYIVRAREFQTVYSGTSYQCKVNKLLEQSDHRFRVCAETDHAGIGDYSDEYVFRTSAALPSSIKAPRIVEVPSPASSLPLAPASTASSSSTGTCSERNCLTLEWQHSKNSFHDTIEYLLQCTKNKDTEFKTVYRGPDTRYTLDHLESGADYTFRVCPIRISDNGDLFGAYSPTLRHHVVRSIESNVMGNSALVQHRNSNMESADAQHLASNRSVGSIKRIVSRYTSILSSRKPLSDQQKAFAIAIIFMFFTAVFAAIIKQWW